MRFGDPGNPVKEECKWRNTNLLSSPVVFWGQRGWVLGLQFRDWRVGGGQNHHTGFRDDSSHKVDMGIALHSCVGTTLSQNPITMPDVPQSCLVGGGGGARPAPSLMLTRRLVWAHQLSHPWD